MANQIKERHTSEEKIDKKFDPSNKSSSLYTSLAPAVPENSQNPFFC